MVPLTENEIQSQKMIPLTIQDQADKTEMTLKSSENSFFP